MGLLDGAERELRIRDPELLALIGERRVARDAP